MRRSTLFIPTLAIALGCGGRESGTNAGGTGGGMTAGSGIGAGSDSGAGGGSSGTITSAATGSTTAGSGTITTVSSGASVPCVVTTCDNQCFDNCGNVCTGGLCMTSGSSAGSCTLNSDCAPGLICTLGQCRPQCASDVDCGSGTCVSGVCRPPPQETGDFDGGGDAKVPLNHRAVGATCPSKRGPSTSNFPACPTPPTASCCSSDADCKGGTNGRCNTYFFAPSECSYDECFTDSNCPSETPCICRSSSTDNTPNTCVPGGNCVVDSNCGARGYCSPSPPSQCGNPAPYYCHTHADACVNDTDCPAIDAGPGVATGPSVCAYDLQAQHWACSPEAICTLP